MSFNSPTTVLADRLRKKSVWTSLDVPNAIPINVPLLVLTKDGKYNVMYYYPKFKNGSVIDGSRARRAWVSVSMEQYEMGMTHSFEWIPFHGVKKYFEFPQP